MNVDIDAEMKRVGQFGFHQMSIFVILFIPMLMVGAINLSYVFIAGVPNHRCYVPHCDFKKSDFSQSFINFTIPLKPDGTMDQCRRFVYLKPDAPINPSYHNPAKLPQTCQPEMFSSNETEVCYDGYVYDRSVYHNTIVSQFNLVCEKESAGPTTQMIFFVGILVGSGLFGLMSDKVGRKFTIFMGLVGMVLFGLLIACFHKLAVFNTLRFLLAMCTAGFFQTSFILVVEFVGQDYRAICSMFGQLVFACGEILLAGIAYLARDWVTIQFAITLPCLVGLLLSFLLPESPRYLLSQKFYNRLRILMGKLKQASDRNCGRLEFSVLPIYKDVHSVDAEDSYSFLESDGSGPDTVPKVTWREFASTPALPIRFAAMAFIWVVVTLLFYGLSFLSAQIKIFDSLNQNYFDFMTLAAIEVPSYVATYLLLSRIGRRVTLICALIVAGLASVAAAVIPSEDPRIILGTFILGKSAATSAFGTIYLFTAELFPTSMRNTVLGVCSMAGRGGGMVASYIGELRNICPPLPMILLGVMGILAAAISFYFPETKGKCLPNTLQEALNPTKREPLLLAVSSEDSEPLSSSVHDGENQAAEEDGQEEENPNDEVPLISSP